MRFFVCICSSLHQRAAAQARCKPSAVIGDNDNDNDDDGVDNTGGDGPILMLVPLLV